MRKHPRQNGWVPCLAVLLLLQSDKVLAFSHPRLLASLPSPSSYGFSWTSVIVPMAQDTSRRIGSSSIGHYYYDHYQAVPTLLASKKRKDDDNNEQGEDEKERSERGLQDAFRQLDALDSLLDNDEKPPPAPPSPKPINSTAVPPLDTSDASPAPPEQEMQLYKDMVQELESTREEDLYSDVLADMGGTSSKKKDKKKTATEALPEDESTELTTLLEKSSISSDDKTKSTEDFMNQALEEAIRDVKVNNPKSAVDNILNDKEIMEEIEAIFERGNQELLASLEKLREEQEKVARDEASQKANKATEDMEADARRLAAAEESMQNKLKQVNKEAQEVAKAVAELEQAKSELDSNFLVKLRNGGIPKQLSLVGLILFSVRSIADTVAAVSNGTDMTAALIQGALAIVCAILFFVL